MRPHDENMLDDPYEVLGVGREADQAQIKRAYFKKVRTHTPEHAPEKFQQVRSAYERLRTPERRAETDLFLLQPPPATPNRRAPSYDLSVHLEDVVTLALERFAAGLAAREKIREPDLLQPERDT